MAVMGVAKFERFFRVAASLDVDKSDLKRYSDFLENKIYDMFLIAEAVAKSNGRDIIQPRDLPITKGLQECMHQFRKLEEGIELEPLIEQLAARPPLDVTISEETEQRLPELAGGLSLALARSFRIIDPDLKNPSSEHWDRTFQLFDLLL
jgi:histone H3/H4